MSRGRWDKGYVIPFVVSLLLLLALCFSIASLAVIDWQKLDIMFSPEVNNTITDRLVDEDTHVEAWMGLFKARAKISDFVFEVNWEDMRRFSPEVDVAKYDLAGRITAGLLATAAIVHVGACILLAFVSLQKPSSSRSTRLFAALGCIIAALLYFTAIITWTQRIPKKPAKTWVENADHKESLRTCFYLALSAGFICIFSGIAIFWWKGHGDSRSHMRSGNVARGPMLARVQPSVLPLMTLIFAVVSAVLGVAAMAMIDFEEQYYSQPTPKVQNEEGDEVLDMGSVGVFLGLLKVRVEQGCFTFTTDWSSVYKFPGIEDDKDQVKTFKSYENAGKTACVFLSMSVASIFLFLVVGFASISGRPTLLKRWLAFVIGMSSSILAFIGVIAWDIMKPNKAAIFAPPGMEDSPTVTRYRGTSYGLSVLYGVIMILASVIAFYWKTPYELLQPDLEDEDEEGPFNDSWEMSRFSSSRVNISTGSNGIPGSYPDFWRSNHIQRRPLTEKISGFQQYPFPTFSSQWPPENKPFDFIGNVFNGSSKKMVLPPLRLDKIRQEGKRCVPEPQVISPHQGKRNYPHIPRPPDKPCGKCVFRSRKCAPKTERLFNKRVFPTHPNRLNCQHEAPLFHRSKKFPSRGGENPVYPWRVRKYHEGYRCNGVPVDPNMKRYGGPFSIRSIIHNNEPLKRPGNLTVR